MNVSKVSGGNAMDKMCIMRWVEGYRWAVIFSVRVLLAVQNGESEDTKQREVLEIHIPKKHILLEVFLRQP